MSCESRGSKRNKLNESIEELLPFYALGTLTPEERDRVEAYLQANPQAAAMLEEMRQVASFLPYSVPAAQASPFAESKLKERIQTEKAAPRSVPAAEGS